MSPFLRARYTVLPGNPDVSLKETQKSLKIISVTAGLSLLVEKF